MLWMALGGRGLSQDIVTHSGVIAPRYCEVRVNQQQQQQHKRTHKKGQDEESEVEKKKKFNLHYSVTQNIIFMVMMLTLNAKKVTIPATCGQ